MALCRKGGGDYSVAYALHYPNGEGGAPTLSQEVAGEAGTNVKAHVDPSLVVVEPVADVAGLDVFDPTVKRWLSVEGASRAPGRLFVVFGGSGLERATKGRIKACLHRVVASNYHATEAEPEAEPKAHAATASKRRFCFIYEQKIEEFY